MNRGFKHLGATYLRELWLSVTLPVAGQEWVLPSIPCVNLNGKKLNYFSCEVPQSKCMCHLVLILGSERKGSFIAEAAQASGCRGEVEVEPGAKQVCA